MEEGSIFLSGSVYHRGIVLGISLEVRHTMKTLECKQIYLSLPPVLSETDTVSLDLELSGLREEQLHRPAGRFVSLDIS